MSGTGFGDTCPNCEGNMECYADHKPFNTESGQCLECGFYYHTVAKQDTLEDLNIAREEHNDTHELEGEDRLQPLTELPEIRDKLKSWMTELL